MPALENLITDSQVTVLRQGYDDIEIYGLAMAALAGPFPQAEPWVSASGSYFFASDRNMGSTHRELCILSTLTAMRCPDQLVVHVYWALMVGLTVNQVADAIFLGGHFGGIAAYNSATKAAMVALGSLAGQADAGKADPSTLLSAGRVVPKLGQAYGRAVAGLPPG